MMNKWISYQNRSKICKFKISKSSNNSRFNNKICKCKPKRKKDYSNQAYQFVWNNDCEKKMKEDLEVI